jgi:nucleoid-associated protein YgaU
MRRANGMAIVAIVVAAAAVTGCKTPEAPDVAVSVEPPMSPVEDIRPLEDLAPSRPATTAEAPARPTPPPARTHEAPAPEPTTYTIRRGDTLWSLAQRRLGSGRRWTEIATANPGLQPQALRIGQVIRIPCQ